MFGKKVVDETNSMMACKEIKLKFGKQDSGTNTSDLDDDIC